MKDLPFRVWPLYEDQTRMKHQVFSDYFDKWVKIVGKYRKVVYFDGFSGCGAYDDKGTVKFGSPILAAQIAEKNRLNLKRDARLVIIDANKENVDNIKKILECLKLDIKPIFVSEDFDKTVNEVLDDVKNLAPTFFFIDPFGFKIKMATLRKIMERPNTEILLTFMYNAIARFLEAEKIEVAFNELFDCEDWKKIRAEKGSNRENAIIRLYRTKLKEFSHFVYQYRMSFPDKERTYYYLFHLTNHPLGCSIMKSCFAKYNFGKVEYLGRLNAQKTLSEYAGTKAEDIKKDILSILDSPRKYSNILETLIDETPYLESELIKTLKKLEEEQKICIVREPASTPTGRLRKSIELQDTVIKKE